MKKKSTFEKKYPLFSKYFTDLTIQDNMLDNADLLRKYEKHNQLISMFIGVLDSHFDLETVKEMIIESIIKLPDEMLLSLIQAYLASDEAAKSNLDFIKYFNKTSNFGRESLDYIVANGLITNRKYREIPSLAIDYHYNCVKTGEEKFKGVHLENVYEYLTYPQRSFVISLIEHKVFDSLDQIFVNNNLNMLNVIKILMSKGINTNILNKESLECLGNNNMMMLLYLLIDEYDPTEGIKIVTEMFKEKRFDLVKQIISNNYISLLGNVNLSNLASMSDEEVIKLLNTKELVLAKQCA